MKWSPMLVLVLAVAVSGSALGEDRQKARAAYVRATQHYDLGEFDAALQDFKEAYRNLEDPSFLYNIAQCHRQLKHKADAIVFYRSYLRKSGEASNRDEVIGIVKRLQAEIDAEHAPQLTAPAPATAETTPSLTRAAPPKPLHRRWYFWTALAGGAVVVGGAIALGVGLSRLPPQSATDLGTLQPTFR